MYFKRKLFFGGAIVLVALGLAGCQSNSSNSSSSTASTSSSKSTESSNEDSELTMSDVVGTYFNKDKSVAIVMMNTHRVSILEKKNVNQENHNDSGDWHYDSGNKNNAKFTFHDIEHTEDNAKGQNTWVKSPDMKAVLKGKTLIVTSQDGSNKQVFTKSSNNQDAESVYNKPVDDSSLHGDPSTDANNYSSN